MNIAFPKDNDLASRSLAYWNKKHISSSRRLGLSLFYLLC